MVVSSTPRFPPILSGKKRFDTMTILDTVNRLSPTTWSSLTTSIVPKAPTNSKLILKRPERNRPRQRISPSLILLPVMLSLINPLAMDSIAIATPIKQNIYPIESSVKLMFSFRKRLKEVCSTPK
jgi:hypothetical protein